MKLAVADYPLSEKRADLIRTRTGKALSEITVAALKSGAATMDDLRITRDSLLLQAEIAEAAGRPRLGANFRRAADMVDVPQDFLLQAYELLRPGRAKNKAQLLDTARVFRETYKAERVAAFLEEAAEVYERRGLFQFRY
ncbi:diol dehydratase small subunit [Dongia sedimenti]|uniref:Diol dehydratase small subunit n=1 Tax=Dongia sedimenti TaxID=3064282 RepID=A0ABU0YIM8_9PROT|nr:diol dehydratase small subunit [Rhodospirillaceae bacterium R-7]